MRYCPKCKTEFQDPIKICIHCGTELVEAPPGNVSEHISGNQLDRNPAVKWENQPQPEGVRKCAKCSSANLEGARFCAKCGTPLENLIPEHIVPSLEILTQEIKSLQLAMGQLSESLTRRITALERLQGSAPPAAPEPRPVSPPPAPPTVAAPVRAVGTVSPRPAPVFKSPAAEPAPFRPVPAKKMARSREWEQILGGNWLVRIGILALIVGVAFFLKFAYENEAFGPLVRILLGVGFGVILLGFGFYWRGRYPVFAQALAGGGIAVIYLSVFAAFAVFRVIGLYPAVGLLFLVSLGSAVIAIRSNSMALAILGIIGAFGGPFFLGVSTPVRTGVGFSDRGMQFLVYILIINIGVLVLSAFRNWRWFNLLALFGSLITFAIWDSQYGNRAGLIVREGSITVLFLMFVGSTTLFHLVWRRICRAFDYTLMMINATAYFTISYALMWSTLRPWIGFFTFLIAVFYGGLSYWARKRGSGNFLLSYFAAGIGIVFLTIAIPVQLGDNAWATVAWAIEAAVLMRFSFVLPEARFRIYSFAAFGLMAFRLMFIDTSWSKGTAMPVFSERALAFLFSIAIMYATSYIVWRRGRTHLFAIFLTVANLFSLWLIGAVILSFMSGQFTDQAILVPIFFIIIAGATTWLPFVLWRRPGKTIDVILIIIDAVFYFGISAALWDHFRVWMGGLYLLLALFHGGLAYFLLRKRREDKPVLINCLAGISITFLTVAIPVQFGHGVWTSLAWSIEMLVLVWLSFFNRVSFLRYYSYFLFIILSGKLLIFNTSVDVKNFHPIINERFFEYMISILASYLVVYLMWRKRAATPDWNTPVTTILVIVNFLTLWIFSFEVWNYFSRLQTSLTSLELIGPTGQALKNAQNLSLTAIWALYAVILLTIGVLKNIRLLRLWALALLAVPIIKVFAYDVFALETIYKIIAFIVLGLLLIVGGYLYQRYSKTIRGYLIKTK